MEVVRITPRGYCHGVVKAINIAREQGRSADGLIYARVGAAPEETWNIIDYALKHGRRGLPGGSSLARLLGECLPAYNRVLTLEMIVAWGEAAFRAGCGSMSAWAA